MKYTPGQFTSDYYQMWAMGLLLPAPPNASIYSVKYRKNHFDVFSRVTLKAVSVSDALERACYAITYASQWRPEDIDLHAVYDSEENLLWIDEPFYDLVQKRNEFRGMERREFLAKFAMTSAAILFGVHPSVSNSATTSVSLGGSASGFSGEQIYTTAGSYNWSVPSNVTSVSVVCVGGGGGGHSTGAGGAGALAWANSLTVTPSSVIVVVAGAAGLSFGSGTATAGGNSTFNGSSVAAGGGSPGQSNEVGGLGGNVIQGSGGKGGNGGTGASCCGGYPHAGGGGAGGYSGAGGNGGNGSPNFISGLNGSGGGAGGGGSYGGGGGVGIYGQGTSGLGQTVFGDNSTKSGSGGQVQANNTFYAGAFYGGGGGGNSPGSGGTGAVRIIWGAGRSFPNNAS